MVHVACGQQIGDRAEELAVLHPEGDHFQVDPLQVLGLQEIQHLLVRAVLRDERPGLAVDLGELLDGLQLDRRRGGQQQFVLGDVDRVVVERARQREVEVVFDGRRVERFQVHGHAARVLAVEHGDRALRDLQQQRQLLRRGRGIGDHDLATVHGLHQELVGDVLVDLLVVHDAIAVVEAEEVLAHQDRRVALRPVPPRGSLRGTRSAGSWWTGSVAHR